ncbi:hypothetical protein AgCh_005341 [Apium graveolens]
MFHQLSALNTSSTAWRLNNRITRMWPSQSSNEMLKGYNLILLDAHNSQPLRMDVDDLMIPLHKFELDIIGVIEDFERVKSIKTIYFDKYIVKFRMTDGRYKIVVLTGDSNEAFNFVLMDKPVKRMVGQTATKMRLDNPNVHICIPRGLLKDIAGKEVTFIIHITDNNVKLESQIYKAIKCFDKEYSISSAFDTTIVDFATSSSSELAAMVRFKQTTRKTCDADASDDTIAFSVYAELRHEFDMLQGMYDRLLDRLKNVYPDSRNYEGKPKEQMTVRLETLVQYVNTKLEEIPSHRDRMSQYIIQMVADELQSIVKMLREEKTCNTPKSGVGDSGCHEFHFPFQYLILTVNQLLRTVTPQYTHIHHKL